MSVVCVSDFAVSTRLMMREEDSEVGYVNNELSFHCIGRYIRKYEVYLPFNSTIQVKKQMVALSLKIWTKLTKRAHKKVLQEANPSFQHLPHGRKKKTNESSIV